MGLAHQPSLSLISSSFVPSLNELLDEVDAVSGPTVFRCKDPQQKVCINVIAFADDEGDPVQADDNTVVVDVERSFDDGVTWAVLQTLTGSGAYDIYYPNGAVRWRFILKDLGASIEVRLQAIA